MQNEKSTLGEARALLKKYGQEHILNNYEKLTDVKKEKILEDINTVNFELIRGLYQKTKKEELNIKEEISSIEYLDKYKLNEKYKYYEEIGKKAIREGKLAAVTMAGGQGTRLRTSRPQRYF